MFFTDDESIAHADDAVARRACLFESRREAARPMVDNPWLLPAEFVVDRDGRLTTAHRFQYCEHWIDPRVHLAAIRFASGELLPAQDSLHRG